MNDYLVSRGCKQCKVLASRIAELEVKNAKLTNYMQRVQEAVWAFEALRGSDK
jgi:hypothetical protein